MRLSRISHHSLWYRLKKYSCMTSNQCGVQSIAKKCLKADWILQRRNSPYGFMRAVSVIGLLLLCCVHSSSSSVSFDYVPHPEFLEKTKELNVTSFIGHTARLPCTIRQLGTKRVSWIRGKDLQVLATGRTSFATDIRVSVLPGTGSPKKHKRSLFGRLPTPMFYSAKSKHLREKSHESNTHHSLIYKKYIHNERKRRSPLGHSQRYPETNPRPYYSHLHLKSDGSYEQLHKYVDPDPSLNYAQQLQASSSNLFLRNKKKRNNSQLPTEITPLKPLRSFNSSDERGFALSKNISSDVYQGSILIHPSGSNVMTDDPDSKRTIIPYNYLDDVWEPEDYTLQIKFAERGDAGEYICQINTEPRMTQVIQLSVVDMVAEIEGNKELIVKEGSPVTLICIVAHEGMLPGFIFWFKQGRLVDYVNSQGRIEIKTTNEGRSELLLRHAVANDSANYTCEPSGGKRASVTLTVIVDVPPVPVHQGSAGGQITFSFLSIFPHVLSHCTIKQSRFNIFTSLVFIYSVFPFIWHYL